MQTIAEAAPALLASNLLAAARAHENSKLRPASSGSAVVDEEALSGGFRYGEITSIAGASGTGKTLVSLACSYIEICSRSCRLYLVMPQPRLLNTNLLLSPACVALCANTDDMHPQLAYHAISSHLLAFPLGEVAFIDTTGSFSPLRLRNVLAFRLEAKQQQQSYQQSGYMYVKAPSNARDAQQAFVNEATAMLDRVKVMRVFDFAGLIEAVGEVGEMRERASQTSVNAPSVPAGRMRDEVGDSEEEVEEDDDAPGSPAAMEGGSDAQKGQVVIIVIDTITNVVSSLMSKSQTQGQALLASFMRSLHHLTLRHHICTISTNAAVGLTSFENPQYKRRPEDNVSIFSSTMGKPALGKTFAYLIDTSVFLSEVPKIANDAVIAFGERGVGASFQKATIVELLKDRRGTRAGQWAAFEIADEVKIIPCRS